MMDAIGITQHHDGITGTATQAVMNDYSRRLNLAMGHNQETYSYLMAPNLTQCVVTNTTYLDCPIADFEDKEGYTMNIVIHNPSTVDMKSARIAVPDGHFEVDAPATVTCHEDYIQGAHIDSCFMDIDIVIPAMSVSTIKIKQNSDEDLQVMTLSLLDGDKLVRNDIELKFIQLDTFDSIAKFEYSDGFNTENLTFSLKYW